jgi:peptidylprolyl isomerase
VKYLGLVAISCVVLALVACADDDSPGEPEKSKTTKLTKPEVKPPSGAPPKELVIEDVKKGSGPAAEVGDKVTVHYVADNKTGNETFSSWRSHRPLIFKLGVGRYFRGFEEGLKGMQAGGRRELSVPSRLAFGGGPLFYVVDLLAIE